MKGAVLPLVGLALRCGGHLLLPLLLAAGPVGLVGLVAGPAPVVVAVAGAGVLVAAWVLRRRACAAPTEPLSVSR